MIYLLYFSSIFTLNFFFKKRIEAWILALLLTFSFLAFSFPAGNDWIGYFTNYNCIINNKCYNNFILFESGYQLIVQTIGNLGFQSIIIFIALLNIFFIGKFSKSFDNKIIIILFIMCSFLWGMYMEAVRQSLAFGLVLTSLHALYKNKTISFIILILIASTFHITSLISLFFLLPYLNKILAHIIFIALILFSLVFVMMPNEILQLLLSFLPIESNANAKLDFYLNSDAYTPQVSIGLGLLFDILLLFVLIFTIYKTDKHKLYNNYKFHLSVLIGNSLFITFVMITGRMMPVLTRIGWYGYPMMLILTYTLIGNSVYYKKINITKFSRLSKLILIIYFLMQIIRPFTYGHSYYGIFHQQTIFQKINELDDQSLELEADKKCKKLAELGYAYLCD